MRGGRSKESDEGVRRFVTMSCEMCMDREKPGCRCAGKTALLGGVLAESGPSGESRLASISCAERGCMKNECAEIFENL